MSDLIAPESEFQVTQEKEQVRPPAMFQGKPLAPYSRGTRILYNMVIEENDLVIYRILAFLYIHLHPRADVIPLVWGDINNFRETILEFRDTLTDADETEAQRLVNEIFAADAATRVVAEPDDATNSHSGSGAKKNADAT